MAAHTKPNFSLGLTLSLAAHVVLAYLVLFKLTSNSSSFLDHTIYSVTLEGGKNLGGISQTPKDTKSQIAPPRRASSAPELPKIIPPKLEKISTPSKIDTKKLQEEISLAEKQKQKLEEKKKAEIEKQKELEKRKKEEKEKKLEAENLDKDFAKIMQRYKGESTDAGGKNFGAAKIGGNGMGGGVLRPPEFFTYRDLLKTHIKRSWRWYDSAASLVAWATFSIDPEGRISDVAIAQSSGNSEFDASVVRAINKASPVPAPPETVYEFFKSVRISFDPRE